jgi:DNA polymerase-1
VALEGAIIVTVVPALLGSSVPIPSTQWDMATGPDAIGVALGMRHAPVACDIETHGLGPLAWKMKAVVFSNGYTTAVLDPRDPQQAEVAKRVLTDAPELIFHNSSFDVPVLYQNKLLPYSSIDKITDTLLHARLANPDTFTPKSLEAVGDRLSVHAKGTPIKTVFKQLGISTAEGFHRFDLDVVQYLYGAALDGLVTYHIAPLIRNEAKKTLESNPYGSFRVSGSELERLLDREQIVNRVLLRRACLGMRVDFEFAETYRRENQGAIDVAHAELSKYGVKPGDGGSLLKFLDGIGAIDKNHPKTPTGKLQATAAVLEGMDHPLAKVFVDAKKLVKLDRDYLSKMEEMSKPTGGRVHPRTNILAAVTGRSSVSDPPLQQMPPAARGILMADEGRELSTIDYSQVEPFFAANIAGDLAVLKGYESGESDLYTDLAEFASARGAYLPRKGAKVVLLAQVYGEGMAKLSKDMGLDPGPLVEREDGTWTHTYEEARAIRAQIFEVMPKTEELITNLRNASNRHRCITTVSGRLVPVPVYRNKVTGKEDVAGYKGVNYFVQGSSLDLLSEAVVSIHEAGLADACYLTVHDEIVCDTEAAEDIQRIMEIPCPAFVRAAERTPRVRTERADVGVRWQKG